MSQEISVSYQAIKSKVYRLIDAAVEGEKTEAQVQESMLRWWKLIHPADRVIAQKYLLRILERSHASLNAMTHAFLETREGVENHPVHAGGVGYEQREVKR